MANPARRRHFPKLGEFLEYAHKRSPLNRADAMFGIVGVFGTLLTAAMSVAVGLNWGWDAAIPVFLFGSGAVAFAIVRLYKETYRPADEERRIVSEAYKTARKMLPHLRKRRLHRHFDLSVAEVLEACAFHWARVRRALEGPLWSRDDLDGHWSAVREQASRAADQAMFEAIYLSRNSYREVAKKTGREWIEWAEDAFDFDADQVLGKIGLPPRAAEDDDLDPTLLRPLHQIGAKLRSLAGELENAPVPSLAANADLLTGGVSGIDLALNEIGALRVAERELNDSVEQRLGG
ncbi:MAG: hypothetical protein KIS66_13385 [Fimbriimonadaceae bacterium]|nr:hypothetical protein [Fimbriimonadaceae bacterium]